MVEEVVRAAKSGYLTTMRDALRYLLHGSADFTYSDVQRISDDYTEIIDKKRSVLRVLTSTAQFSREISVKELEELNARRTRLAERLVPVIQDIIHLWDRVKLYSPDKGKDERMIDRLLEQLRILAIEIGHSSKSGISHMEVTEKRSATSESGYGSNEVPLVEVLKLGSQEDVSKAESDVAGCKRLIRDLDSAVVVIDKHWIPADARVIFGQVTDYPKEAFDYMTANYEGSCRIFIHFGLIIVRRRPSGLHSGVTSAVNLDILEAFNNGLPYLEFRANFEINRKYINRFGCGYEMDQKSDGGLLFTSRSQYHQPGAQHPVVAVETAFRNENFLGLLSEASMYLGPSTGVCLFVGARVFNNKRFHIQLFVIRKKPKPKTKQEIFGEFNDDECQYSSTPTSIRIGTRDVPNKGLRKREVHELNEIFDFDIVGVIHVTGAHLTATVNYEIRRILLLILKSIWLRMTDVKSILIFGGHCLMLGMNGFLTDWIQSSVWREKPQRG